MEISKKICMLGSYGVGKTSLVHRFVYNRFDEKYLTTIGAHISKKIIPSTSLRSQDSLKFIIWDIAHIEKFNNVVKNYYHGSHGAIIVFDATRSNTCKDIDIFLKPFLDINPKSKNIFVCNKIDLIENKNIDMEQLLPMSKRYKSSCIFTSAKTCENVEKVFINLGMSLLTTD